MESFRAIKITIPKDDSQGKTLLNGTRIVVIDSDRSERCHLENIFIIIFIKNENEFPGLTDFVFLFFPWSGELKSDNQLNKPSRFSCVAKACLRWASLSGVESPLTASVYVSCSVGVVLAAFPVL